ncbi:hypothetical protein PtA15_6A873 [Puccinia triticina]|uniref:Uncharacterized protein n=1 Tax=Puccinia triticina TaxID=208348 RepID=A0ABY7CLY5_9BASI|nr:uncharacterized protein PtA15_6A873 [Puccinia triticina]WAQ86241.1 hypothetical protein PtA15_6A873 [Puccinia triticina]
MGRLLRRVSFVVSEQAGRATSIISSSVISAARTIRKTEGFPFIEPSHALTKRAYPKHQLEVEPGLNWKVPSINLEVESYREGGPHGFRDKRLVKKIQKYKIRIPIRDEGLKVEQHQHLRLIHDTFAILESKERFAPSNIEILIRNLKELGTGPQLSDLVPEGVKGGASRFEIRLFDVLIRCFDEEKLQWWCQLYDSWHSLNTSFLDEVSIILQMKDLRKALHELRVKAQMANSISKNRPNSKSSPVESQTGTVDRDDRSYLYRKIDLISPGIWKFCLPMKNNKLDLTFLRSNPIARLSWFLDGLDPAEMIAYAQALHNPRLLSLPELMRRQLVLEQAYKAEPSQKFAEASWFVQRIGWDQFQRIILEFERLPQHNRKLKVGGPSSRGTRDIFSTGKNLPHCLSDLSEKKKTDISKKALNLSQKGLNDLSKKELNDILEKNKFPTISPEDNLSSNMMDWLRNLCLELVKRLQSWSEPVSRLGNVFMSKLLFCRQCSKF